MGLSKEDAGTGVGDVANQAISVVFNLTVPAK